MDPAWLELTFATLRGGLREKGGGIDITSHAIEGGTHNNISFYGIYFGLLFSM